MKHVFLTIKDAIVSILQNVFTSDLDVMSDEVRQILSNPEDAKKYREAVKELRDGEKDTVTIQLSDRRSLTLTQ